MSSGKGVAVPGVMGPEDGTVGVDKLNCLASPMFGVWFSGTGVRIGRPEMPHVGTSE
jgi:hypothetical protein